MPAKKEFVPVKWSLFVHSTFWNSWNYFSIKVACHLITLSVNNYFLGNSSSTEYNILLLLIYLGANVFLASFTWCRSFIEMWNGIYWRGNIYFVLVGSWCSVKVISAVLCCISPAGVIGLEMKKTQPITWKKGPWSFVCRLLHRVITLRKICHQNTGFQVTENPYIWRSVGQVVPYNL